MPPIRTPAVLLALLFATPAAAYDPAPVAARNGMVVSAQALASQAGVSMLEQGGNAIDAAVAVGYALAVTYPAAGNLGGGGFMTVRFADGTSRFLDFREKAPLAATPTLFLDEAGNVVPGRSAESWLAVGVPGTPAGLEAARARWGALPRAASLAPAIRLAREGFVLTAGDVALIRQGTPALRRDPAASAIFVPGGQPLAPGDRLVQADLARTLSALSAEGPDAFYRGATADAIVAASQAGGGILAKRDFEAYRVRELPPVECSYRGYLIQSAPPPSSGGVVLCEILNILEGDDLRALGFHSAAEVHLLVEAMRHAFFDRNAALGDPDFVQNPLERLLSKRYAASIRALFDRERATPSAALRDGTAVHEGANTTQLSVVDRFGNAVSMTYTLNDWFGVRRVAPGTGVLLNNEMDDFTAKPGVANMFGLVQGAANAVAPGKTPLSSMAPTIVSRDGKTVLVIGSPGGPRIITVTLAAIINMIDHGMTVQEAIDAPRLHHQMLPDTVYVERFALSPDTRALLEQRGYGFTESAPWGVAEGIAIGAPRLTPSGFGAAQSLNLGVPELPGATRFGAHDPRGPAGAALGQ